VESTFFRQAPQRSGDRTLRRFFRRFSGKEKRFSVAAGVSRDFGGYLRRLNYDVKSSTQLPDAIASELLQPAAIELAVTARVDAHDNYSAVVYLNKNSAQFGP